MVVAQINQQKTVREDGLSDPTEAGWKHPARARAFEQHQLDAGRHTPPLGTGRIAGRSRDGSAARRAALVLIAGDVRGGLDGAMILHVRRQPGCPLDLCTGPASCCLRRKGAGFVSSATSRPRGQRSRVPRSARCAGLPTAETSGRHASRAAACWVCSVARCRHRESRWVRSWSARANQSFGGVVGSDEGRWRLMALPQPAARTHDPAPAR